MSPLRRANASSGLVSNVHGGEYVSSCLIFVVPMQFVAFPSTGLGHPWIVLDTTSSAFEMCANGKSIDAAAMEEERNVFRLMAWREASFVRGD